MKLNYRHLLFPLLLASAISARAQEHTQFRPGREWIIRSEDAYNHQFYALAALNARQYMATQMSGIPEGWAQDRQKAQWIRILARLKSGNEDSAILLLKQTVDPAIHDRLALAIARSYFLKGGVGSAIPYYQQAGISNLTNAEIADAKFELAYCLFNVQRFDDAAPLFAIIREVPGKYYSAGNYYYGLLAYNRGEYADALRSFDRINNEPAYRSTVPYYMAELEYYLGNRDKALKEALRLIKRPEKLYYDNELHLLAAQCLFEADRYGEALPYFEYYYNHSEKIRKEELYEMAYSYYRVSEWQHAVEKFRPLSTAQDSLGQTAMYLLGDCYLKTGDKASARNAFGICAAMTYNQGQREAALLLHAQLSQALGFTDDALWSANTLLRDYPATTYASAAYDVLARVYASTRDYASAYRSLQQIDNKPQGFAQLLQPIAYGYGMVQLQNGNLPLADSLLTESLAQNALPAYTAAAAFWKSEIAGRQHQSEEAIRNAEIYLASSKAGSTVAPEASVHSAYLIMGYASMDAQDYPSAQQYFRKAGEGTNTAEASLREADALFMQKNFGAAAPLYAKAAAGSNGGDYAKLQQAIILGLKGKRDEKIRILQSLLNASPPSQYAGDARYELGATLMEGGSYRQAIETLTPLTGNTKYSTLAPKALIKIGTAHQQLNEDEKAEAAYTVIFRSFPSSAERADAQAALKSLYIEHNNPEGYATLLKQYNLDNQGDEDLEAAFYSAAEGQYASQNWKGATGAYQKYVDQFPEGPRAVKAHYYLGESFYQQKLFPQAAAQYNIVLNKDWSDFSESSALRSAVIAYNNQDWTGAINNYGLVRAHATDSALQLQALTGLMRSSAQLGMQNTTTSGVSETTNYIISSGAYADTLLAFNTIAPGLKEEARLYQGRAFMAVNNYSAADALFIPLQSSKSATIAAEASYYHASALLAAGKLKEAENAAGKNIKKGGGGDYWVVRSYILLGDILTAEKDYFNARATLQSVVDHSNVEGLKAEAKRKLDALPKSEDSKLSNE